MLRTEVSTDIHTERKRDHILEVDESSMKDRIKSPEHKCNPRDPSECLVLDDIDTRQLSI